MLKNSLGHTKDDSDESFLKQYRLSGNLEVLGNLYSRYMHLVYGVCLKYLKNRDDAKDAVMQIFEKLISELRRIRDKTVQILALCSHKKLLPDAAQSSEDYRPPYQ